MIHRVFVYGTLKRGNYNHRLLQEFDAKFIGEAQTENRYAMRSHHFPVIFEDNCGLPVAGEIYHVNDDCLARLDQLEGVPHMYERRIDVVTENGKPVKTHIYVATAGFWD